MLLIKLSAADLKMIEKARTPEEFAGIHSLISERVAISKTLREFGKSPTLKKQTYGWQDALKTVKEVWGEGNVRVPPFPDSQWYIRLNTTMKRYGLDEDAVRKVAEYAKANLKGPGITLDFLLTQQQRILAGEFDVHKPFQGHGGPDNEGFGPELPEE